LHFVYFPKTVLADRKELSLALENSEPQIAVSCYLLAY